MLYTTPRFSAPSPTCRDRAQCVACTLCILATAVWVSEQVCVCTQMQTWELYIIDKGARTVPAASSCLRLLLLHRSSEMNVSYFPPCPEGPHTTSISFFVFFKNALMSDSLLSAPVPTRAISVSTLLRWNSVHDSERPIMQHQTYISAVEPESYT